MIKNVTARVSPFIPVQCLTQANRRDGKAEKFLQRNNGSFSFLYSPPSFKTKTKLKVTNWEYFGLFLARWMANYCGWICPFSEMEHIFAFYWNMVFIWPSWTLFTMSLKTQYRDKIPSITILQCGCWLLCWMNNQLKFPFLCFWEIILPSQQACYFHDLWPM